MLLGSLVACFIASLIGLVVLWPDADAERPELEYAAPGVKFYEAEVVDVRKACPPQPVPGQADSGEPTTAEEGPDGCGTIETRLTEGPDKGDLFEVGVPPDVSESGLKAGDTVTLMLSPAREGVPKQYGFSGVERHLPLLWMTIAFVVVVGLVARWRGLLALVGLGVSGLVVWKFMLPALLIGENGIAVALVGSAAIMFPVLYLAHGPSVRTSTALAGTLLGVAMTAGLGHLAINAGRLSGVSEDSTAMLSQYVPELDFRGLLTCAVIIAALGLLNDVTITQTSAVWELRAAAPTMSRIGLFNSGMRIGRDHLASTIYTIVFAYTGAAMAVLLLISMTDRPFADLITSEAISEEIMRTLASAIGLVLSVPVTTGLAALLVAGPGEAADAVAVDRPGKRRKH